MKKINFVCKNAKVMIVLLLAVMSLFAITGCSSKESKTEDKVLTAEQEKETANLEAEMEEKLKEAKTEEEKDAITKEYSEKIESATHGKVDVVVDGSGNVTVSKPTTNKPSNNTATKPESSKPSGSTTKPENTKPSKPSEPEKKKVWVVDKPAWDEVVDDTSKPIYDYRPTWWIKFYDGSIKTYYDEMEWDYDCTYAPKVASYGTGEYEEVLVGYEKKTIHHPEEGHWEYQ